MHVLAFAQCCEGIEMFLRECTEIEITILVAEDKDKMRKHLKDCVALLRSRPAMIRLSIHWTISHSLLPT